MSVELSGQAKPPSNPEELKAYLKKWGQESSIHSPGVTGRLNRLLARVAGQEEADILSFAAGALGMLPDDKKF